MSLRGRPKIEGGHPIVPGGALGQIAPDSREFLVFLFTDLRDDLASQIGAERPGFSNAKTIARTQGIYDALLSGLTEGGQPPEDETVREYIVALAKATDKENQYEQAVLEHRAFAELVRALGGDSPTEPGAAAVDWDGLLASLLHPTQFQMIEAMHWIGQPVSASQLLHILDHGRKDLSAFSYHLRRLSELKIVRLVSVKRVRGAKERLYKLGVVNRP
jgi:DNA-binding transcriptional ArsR family regulator